MTDTFINFKTGVIFSKQFKGGHETDATSTGQSVSCISGFTEAANYIHIKIRTIIINL